MKQTTLTAAVAALTLGAGILLWQVGMAPAAAQDGRRFDYDPDLKTKIVPILTMGSSINVGAAQVQGAEADVAKVKAVAQLETDYKDVARIKILVPIQTEKALSNINRAPGVSVSAIADYAIKK